MRTACHCKFLQTFYCFFHRDIGSQFSIDSEQGSHHFFTARLIIIFIGGSAFGDEVDKSIDIGFMVDFDVRGGCNFFLYLFPEHFFFEDVVGEFLLVFVFVFPVVFLLGQCSFWRILEDEDSVIFSIGFGLSNQVVGEVILLLISKHVVVYILFMIKKYQLRHK